MLVAIEDFHDHVILLQLLESFRFLFFLCNASTVSRLFENLSKHY